MHYNLIEHRNMFSILLGVDFMKTSTLAIIVIIFEEE